MKTHVLHYDDQDFIILNKALKAQERKLKGEKREACKLLRENLVSHVKAVRGEKYFNENLSE